MKKNHMYLLVGLLFLIFGFFLFRKSPPPPPKELLVENDFHQELTHIALKLHTSDGDMFLKLKADRIVEYPPPAPSTIFALDAVLYEGEEPLFSFIGEEGHISSGRDSLMVKGPVLVSSEKASFTSGYLFWGVDEGILLGADGISYQDEVLSITAGSFSYDPGKKKVYLMDKVRLVLKKEE